MKPDSFTLFFFFCVGILTYYSRLLHQVRSIGLWTSQTRLLVLWEFGLEVTLGREVKDPQLDADRLAEEAEKKRGCCKEREGAFSSVAAGRHYLLYFCPLPICRPVIYSYSWMSSCGCFSSHDHANVYGETKPSNCTSGVIRHLGLHEYHSDFHMNEATESVNATRNSHPNASQAY